MLCAVKQLKLKSKLDERRREAWEKRGVPGSWSTGQHLTTDEISTPGAGKTAGGRGVSGLCRCHHKCAHEG